jgi:predicted amidohydrolase YtcJ
MSAGARKTFVNGKVFTARNEEEFATAFTIVDSTIRWVGHASEVNDPAAIDLQGRTVLPGLIDVHTHPTLVAGTATCIPCTVPAVKSIAEMIEALRGHPRLGRGEKDWIEGFGYDESKLAEHRTPTSADLDRVSVTQPVLVMRSDCHSAVCNSRALALAGITRATPDPPGARFGRDEKGKPNGLLQELAAIEAVSRVKPAPSYDRKVQELAAVGSHYNARGIVAVSDMMALRQPFDDLEIYRAAAQRGFWQQAMLYFDWAKLKHNSGANLTEAERAGRIRWAGVKLFADGTISGRTAWVSEAYRDSSAHGLAIATEEDLRSACQWARRNQVQLAVHVMGDAACQQVIDCLADQSPWLGESIPSVRLEHITLLNPAQMREMKRARMHFGAATQIIFLFAEYDSYRQNLSDAQFQRAYPLKNFYREIDHLALSSDAPATTWTDPDDVFVSIKAAVTRRACNGAAMTPAQAITVAQAVLLYTARAATVAPFAGQLGRIAPDFEASFIVLDRDIFTVDPNQLDQTRVLETWIRGERVYAAAGTEVRHLA